MPQVTLNYHQFDLGRSFAKIVVKYPIVSLWPFNNLFYTKCGFWNWNNESKLLVARIGVSMSRDDEIPSNSYCCLLLNSLSSSQDWQIIRAGVGGQEVEEDVDDVAGDQRLLRVVPGRHVGDHCSHLVLRKKDGFNIL